MTKYNDYPIEVCMKEAERLIVGGAIVHQKFTCAHCGSRQTIEEPNKFFTEGVCEACGTTTDIKKQGCNYLVHMQIGKRK